MSTSKEMNAVTKQVDVKLIPDSVQEYFESRKTTCLGLHRNSSLPNTSVS